MIQRLFPFSSNPCRSLLYLEWLLIGISLLQIINAGVYDLIGATNPPIAPWVPLGAIALFTSMRWYLPTRQLGPKLLYLVLELALVIVAVLPYQVFSQFYELLLVIAIRSGLMFQMRGRIWVAIAVFLSLWSRQLVGVLGIVTWSITPDQGLQLTVTAEVEGALPLQPLDLIWGDLVEQPGIFAFMLGLTVLAVSALITEQEQQKQLAIAHQQLRHYALRIEDQATLQERNRIARDIHDSIGHLLTAQRIQLENVDLFLDSDPPKSRIFLQEGQTLACEALTELRQSIEALRSDPMQGQSLRQAVQQLIHQFEQRTGIVPNCQLHLPPQLSSEIRINLYRIVQEALTNITNYSQATAVDIRLQNRCQHGRLALHLIVSDNGQGFDPEANRTGFGLMGMEERVLSLGGELQIMSSLGQGCTILAAIPLSLSPS